MGLASKLDTVRLARRCDFKLPGRGLHRVTDTVKSWAEKYPHLAGDQKQRPHEWGLKRHYTGLQSPVYSGLLGGLKPDARAERVQRDSTAITGVMSTDRVQSRAAMLSVLQLTDPAKSPCCRRAFALVRHALCTSPKGVRTIPCRSYPPLPNGKVNRTVPAKLDRSPSGSDTNR